MAFYNQGLPMQPHGSNPPVQNPFLPHQQQNHAAQPQQQQQQQQQQQPMQPMHPLQPMQPMQPLQQPQQAQQQQGFAPYKQGPSNEAKLNVALENEVALYQRDAPPDSTGPFGALARGYPDTPWSCPACTLINVSDRLECAACETERPPLNVGAANARHRDQSYFGGRGLQSGWGWGNQQAQPAAGAGAGAGGVDQSSNNPGLPDRQSTFRSEGGPGGQAGASGAGRPADEDLASVACLSQEQFTYLLSIALLFYQGFRTVMACLLSLFVPQHCVAEPFHSNPNFRVPHDCTMEENFQELTNFNIFVTSWNFITLACCLVQYFLVWRREKMLIEWLDEDPSVTNDYLVKKNRRGQTVIEMYPLIQTAVRKHNTLVLVASVLTILLFFVNVIVSGILCFRDYYAGYRTITVFLTNISLTFTVILSQCNYAYSGVQTGVALSMYKSDPAVYNAIDRRLRNSPEFFVPRKKISKETSAIEMNETTYKVK